MKESKTQDPKEIPFESNQEDIITSEYKNWIVDLKLQNCSDSQLHPKQYFKLER